jgi:2,7-dihydroxy-5-methyl-1-naphthoate 7-O-methyltransferase
MAEKANLETMSDLRTPWCVHVAATLRIADHIQAGIDQIDDLAVAAECNASVLHQVLGHLVGKGVFEEPSPGRFALNEAAQDFFNPGLQLALDLDGIGGRMAYAWGTLLSYVRSGAPAYHEHFGLSFWEDLAAHPEVSASFDALIGPEGHGIPNPEFQISGGWGTIRTIADVGGGTGFMLAEILKTHPGIRGILVDQPKTVARSGDHFKAAGVAERVTTAGQSFFDPLPAGADLYLLRGIINDWPDREAIKILSRCAEAARPAGRVVILKGVGPDDESKELPIESVLLGGRRRTISEIRELARESGLEVISAGAQPSGYFVVECRLARQT